MKRPLQSLGAVVALLVVLTGCAGLPTEGPVSAGLPPGSDSVNEVRPDYLPEAPVDGANPEAIVAGFIDAAIGTSDDWSRAREFLTPEFAEQWNPLAGVTVDAASERTTDVAAEDIGEASVTMSVSPDAMVDAEGRYVVSEGGETAFTYELTRNDSGQWRISSAPDGLVLERDLFLSLYSPHDLAYFDQQWQYLVPDRRWLLNRSNSAARVATALITGSPSAWLEPVVQSAFDGGVVLDRAALNGEGILRVELSGENPDDTTTISRMLAQLQESLATAEVAGIEISVDGQVVETTAASVSSTAVDSRPLVFDGGELGYLTGTDIDPIPGLSERIGAFPVDDVVTSITLSADQSVAAVGLLGGRVYRVTADGPDEVDLEGTSIAPAMDRFGYIWTASRDRPESLSAWNADLVTSVVEVPSDEITAIRAMSVSRDGTRIALIVSEGDSQWVAVAAIIRDDTGAPVSLGALEKVAPMRADGTSVAWMDDLTLMIASSATDSGIAREQAIGAPGYSYAAPLGVEVVAPGSNESNARLLTRDGDLSILRGAAGSNRSWQISAENIEVLGIQLGRAS